MVDIFMGLGSFRLMLDAAKNLKNIGDPDIRNDAEARNLETWESEK
jgi:hypothetical protein